jgi:hypothetical protein
VFFEKNVHKFLLLFYLHVLLSLNDNKNKRHKHRLLYHSHMDLKLKKLSRLLLFYQCCPCRNVLIIKNISETETVFCFVFSVISFDIFARSFSSKKPNFD